MVVARLKLRHYCVHGQVRIWQHDAHSATLTTAIREREHAPYPNRATAKLVSSALWIHGRHTPLTFYIGHLTRVWFDEVGPVDRRRSRTFYTHSSLQAAALIVLDGSADPGSFQHRGNRSRLRRLSTKNWNCRVGQFVTPLQCGGESVARLSPLGVRMPSFHNCLTMNICPEPQGPLRSDLLGHTTGSWVSGQAYERPRPPSPPSAVSSVSLLLISSAVVRPRRRVQRS